MFDGEGTAKQIHKAKKNLRKHVLQANLPKKRPVVHFDYINTMIKLIPKKFT
jgi:hypothetical protein